MSHPKYQFSPYVGLPVMAMGLVVLLSNYLVRFPINDWLTWAAFAYPFCFLINDLTNRRFGVSEARKAVYAGFMVGVFLSVLAAYFADDKNLAIRIAIASGLAFLIAQLLDASLFDRLRRRTWWQAPLFSTVIASFVDSLLFFSLAFAATGLPWLTWGLGDFAVKIVMGLCLLPIFAAFTFRMKIYS